MSRSALLLPDYMILQRTGASSTTTLLTKFRVNLCLHTSSDQSGDTAARVVVHAQKNAAAAAAEEHGGSGSDYVSSATVGGHGGYAWNTIATLRRAEIRRASIYDVMAMATMHSACGTQLQLAS